jgi:Phosphotransferase enzyme family
MTTPRAVGVRMPYPDVPARVRRWVDDTLGSRVSSWEDQVGGMSPGCATRLVAADGSCAFVKAVGAELNPDSPTLFRREIEVLDLIGDDPLWAPMRASYDDGGWVALLLDDVPGGHPDLTNDGQMSELLEATDRLVARLGEVPVPPGVLAGDIGGTGLIDARARFRDWRRALDHLDEVPADLLPDILRANRSRLRELVAVLAEGGTDQLLHWDIRIDNLLRPAPGRIVFVDWGAAAVGPRWVDPLLARLERVDQPWFDASIDASPVLGEVGDDLVTGWLVAFGSYLAWRSTQGSADVGLPTLNAFRRTEARRLLSAAARRME